MSTASQRALILVLIALSLGLLVPEFAHPWLPLGSFGMQFALNGDIVEVDAGSSASAAGVRAGDRVDLAATPLGSRRWISSGVASAPTGTVSRFVIVDGKRVRTLELTATNANRQPADDVTNAISVAAWIAFVLIAGALCFLSPSRMTWAFFGYSLASCITELGVVPNIVPFGWYMVLQAVENVGVASGLALVLFALRFPSNEVRGWRRPAERATIVAILATLALAEYVGYKEILSPDRLIGPFYSLLGAIEIVGTLVAIATFAIAYTQAEIGDRARYRWVFAGLAIGQSGLLVFQVLTTIPAVTIAWPPWAINVVLALQLAVPLTIAYAVVRHRVFDIRIVVSRALVYALLTAILVACITGIRFAANTFLAQTRSAAALELLVSIALGFGLNAGYKRVEQIVDSILYRSRTRAAQRLRRLARGLIHATSAASIADAVTREPFDALSLTSAALFRIGDGVYVRVAACAWDAVPLAPLPVDAPAALQMQAEAAPVRFAESTWAAMSFPGGDERPAIAIPIVLRGKIEAIAFFGSHRSGEDVDGEEVVILSNMLRAAGEAFDKLAIDSMLDRIAALERQVSLR